ncbi:hypothetical protein LCGC14_0847710 [marine sediment metagenome]|uniref:Uncharacterized protein n=1 Tax=marine sediment metagenome TaxID=412755 RepID=A0A0F9RW25_9ZZZZ|nr:hypothetical protein [bacterium]
MKKHQVETKIFEFIFDILCFQESQLSLIKIQGIPRQRICCSCNNEIDLTDFVIVRIGIRLKGDKIVSQNVEIEPYCSNCIRICVTRSQKKHAEHKVGASGKICTFFFK